MWTYSHPAFYQSTTLTKKFNFAYLWKTITFLFDTSEFRQKLRHIRIKWHPLSFSSCSSSFSYNTMPCSGCSALYEVKLNF